MEDWTSLGQHKRKPEFPIITRESRRNSRKTTPLRPLRGLQETRVATREESGVLGFPSREPGVSGDSGALHEGCQVPFCPSGRNRGLPLRRRSGQGPHLVKTLEPRGFSRVAAGFSSYDGDFRLPLVSALGNPIFHSSCEGKLGVALESLHGQRDLI